MDASIKTAYACKDGALVHVANVERGLKCGCHCPSCRNPLIARKGIKKVHHFAHIAGSDCVGAAETVLHILAKEIIKDLSSISIPEYRYKRVKYLNNGINVHHEQLLAKGGEVPIDQVHVEQHHGTYKPDIEIFSRGKPLIVEIAVTHRVEKKKLRAIRQENVPAIEIRLNTEHALYDRDKLAAFIGVDTKGKHWLYHPNEKQATTEFFHKYRSAQQPRRDGSSAVLSTRGVARPATPPSRKQTNSMIKADWQPYDALVEEFKRRCGYYPSLEEAGRRWPWLFKPSKQPKSTP